MKTKRKHTTRNLILIGIAVIIVAVVGYNLISNYEAAKPKYNYSYGTYDQSGLISYPDTSFAVMSDVHYYDTSLGTSGKAFEACLASDRKLLKQSAEIFGMAIDDILKSNVKFVLVSGDLTKDGELINHQKMAAGFQRLVDKGVKVYVVPGNHDVENPGAVKYVGDGTEPVQNVSAAEFADIYKNCGYGDAIMRDKDSLSYVAEPQSGLWIVALDTCEYYKNKPGEEETVPGELTQPKIDWLEGVLSQAKEKGKAVIIMEHHGVVEHWKGQAKLHPDYLLTDYKYDGKLYSSYGVRLAFTGHYHAQDITGEDNGSMGFIFDVETGSLSTPPCSMRYCTISGNTFTDKTLHLIDNYSSDFRAQAMDFVKQTIYSEAFKTLRKYHVSEKDSGYIATTVASAYVAHYNGNEDPAQVETVDTGKLSLWGKIIYSQYAYVIRGLSHDLPPKDLNVSFSLASAS